MWPTFLVLARQRVFGVVHDERSALYLSVRAVATLGSTRAPQFLSDDDHCFQSQGPWLRKRLSQLRNEQVDAAGSSRDKSWPSLRVLAHVATTAAHCGAQDRTAAALLLKQNESEKVEQPVVVIRAGGRERLASSPVVQRPALELRDVKTPKNGSKTPR